MAEDTIRLGGSSEVVYFGVEDPGWKKADDMGVFRKFGGGTDSGYKKMDPSEFE